MKHTATKLSSASMYGSYKKAKVDYTITWKILDRAQSYSNATKRCKLRTLEKFYFICKQKLATLNKRTELASTCRHANKFLLKNT